MSESFAPVRVGLIGCGYISDVYLRNAPRFPTFTIVACADAVRERADMRGREYGIPARGVDDLLSDPALEVVLDLTTPTPRLLRRRWTPARASTTRSRSRSPSAKLGGW